MPQTATEFVVELLENFNKSEPEKVLVIYTTEAGDVVWKCSQELTSVSQQIGLLELVKALMLKRCLE